MSFAWRGSTVGLVRQIERRRLQPSPRTWPSGPQPEFRMSLLEAGQHIDPDMYELVHACLAPLRLVLARLAGEVDAGDPGHLERPSDPGRFPGIPFVASADARQHAGRRPRPLFQLGS